jgi:hypothetical protein
MCRWCSFVPLDQLTYRTSLTSTSWLDLVMLQRALGKASPANLGPRMVHGSRHEVTPPRPVSGHRKRATAIDWGDVPFGRLSEGSSGIV